MARRKKGISVLIASQNAARTVELCVRSFEPFGDELIAVDNGSTDGTVEILTRLAGEIPKLAFVNAPHIVHLHQNRQAAFERSRYSWVMRCDSDFIAHTSGPHDARKLRDLILADEPSRPVAYGCARMPNLEHDWWHANGRRPISTSNRRIYSVVPGMRFCRFGRWEGVLLPDGGRHDYMPLNAPWWFHCNLKSSMMDRFLRTERTNWREFGNFDRYPTLLDWVKGYALRRRWRTDDILTACAKWAKGYLRGLRPYDEAQCYPYPDLIREQMERERAHD